MSTGTRKAELALANLAGILAQLDREILALVMSHAPLPRILEALCANLERHYPGLLCSVLLLDGDGKTLRHGAAPSLPEEYNRMVDGVVSGATAGSCGTAAYRQEQVIVTDIATDPLWADYRQLALPHGLRACWSTPIASQKGGVLGTFAIYYRQPRSPEAEHLQLIAHATHLAAIAIEWERDKTGLVAAENRYRTLVERLPAITYVAELGAYGGWHYVSPQIESMLGYSASEWLSDAANWINRIHTEDRESVLAVEERFQKHRDLFQAEYRMHSRDGRILWFRDEAVMLPAAEGQPLLMQGVMYNITERKRLEDQLRHSQKMEAVGVLAGGVAHDFNNLLMLIQGHNERLRAELATDASAQKESHGIEQAVARAASLTARLLAFSRKQVLQPKVLDLNVVLGEVAKMLERLIEKSIVLQVSPALGLWSIKADPGQIEQLIMNLAVNARDAMPEGGRLLIETRNAEIGEPHHPHRDGLQPGHYVVLVVADNGIGMDSETQSHMFEPFFTTKEPGRGTGLGLAIVYGVVQKMGGRVYVESKPGQGTTFEVFLPRADEANVPSAAEKPFDVSSLPTGTETILLVEDEIGIRELAGDFLQSRGYKVLTASDGNEALRIAQGHEDLIHLLVTDVVMPNVGGSELANRLQAVRPQMKVLFMSGYPEHPALPNRGVGEQTTVLQKPFSLDRLAHKVRALLDIR